MRLNVTAVSVRSARNKESLGQLARPLVSASDAVLMRAGIPADVPDDAVVTAHLTYFIRPALSGSREFSLRRNAAGFKVSQVTWDNKPALTGTTHSATVGGVPAGYAVTIDVSADVQSFVSGTATNYGWRLWSDEATGPRLFGASAAVNQPYVEFSYVVPGEAPTNLAPDGAAVGTGAPPLTFTTADDMVALQVQADPAADDVTPDFDSGEVPASGPLFDLAASAFTPLAVDASTDWRVRVKTTLGWGDWSEWASFTYKPLLVPTITSPAATTGDKTPPVTWTAPGQETWQALLYSATTGKLLANSGPVTSSDLAWTPPKGLTKPGDLGRFEVRAIDGEDRVAVPGFPTYGSATQEFELVANGAAPGVDSLIVTQAGVHPAVRLAWASAAADEWQIVRDGEWLDRIDGLLFEFTDHTASPNHLHEYRVLPVADGVVSPNGPTVSVTPTCTGLWLIDPDDGRSAVLWGQDAGSLDMFEQAVVHNIVGAPPVRRRSAVLPPSGSQAGGLLDVFEHAADDQAAALLAFKVADPDHVYRLVLGDWNIPVTIGDVEVGPTPLSSADDRIYDAEFSWWQTRDELPWDA